MKETDGVKKACREKRYMVSTKAIVIVLNI